MDNPAELSAQQLPVQLRSLINDLTMSTQGLRCWLYRITDRVIHLEHRSEKP